MTRHEVEVSARIAKGRAPKGTEMSVEWDQNPEQCEALWLFVCRIMWRLALGAVIWWVVLLIALGFIDGRFA